MRVAFLIQDLFGRGAEYATALLVRGFAEKGYDVDLVVSKVHRDKLSAGLKPFDVPPKTRIVYLKHRRARYNGLEVWRYLKSANADALVVMSPAYEWVVVLASLCLLRSPKLYTVRHMINFALNERLEYRDADDSWFSVLKSRVRYAKFSGILCVSEKVRTETIRLSHIPAAKVYTVYNPAVDDLFFAKKAGHPRHPWLVDKTIPTFVSAGAFRPEKNHMMMIEAFRRVNRIRAARLVIFGEGDLRSQYEKCIKAYGLEDRVSLPGFADSVPAEIAASSGYISASNIESFGIAIVEGLACGVPVISTDAPCGPREILKGGGYGELVKVNDPEDLANAVLRVLDGSAKAAPEESWRRFELPKIVELYEAALCGR